MTTIPRPSLANRPIRSKYLGLGPHIDAARRLVEEEHLALGLQPLRHHDLLLAPPESAWTGLLIDGALIPNRSRQDSAVLRSSRKSMTPKRNGTFARVMF